MIRDATEADLPAIVDIYNATVPSHMVTAELTPTTVEARVSWFRAHGADTHPIWVVEDEGQIAAWLSFSPYIAREAYRATAEVSLYVHEQHRRRGHGRRLLAEGIRRGPSLGLRVLIGNILAHNEPSLRLFGALAFQRWGLLPRVTRFKGVERDLVIVGRHLG